MQTLLRTKLFVPRNPAGVIPRPQLLARLDKGRLGKLSLLTAPAGYGKTTLVTAWLQHLKAQTPAPHILWYSLDESDNDVRRFFAYFVAALGQVDDAIANLPATFLTAGSEVATTALITELINHIAENEEPILLVLDDYHEITEPIIHNTLSLLLDHQPPNLHLVITSRTEPPLPLPRMRVRRQMTDIHAEILRFSDSETAKFLNQHMRLNLSAEHISQLNNITEGWVASLQLAALSLQNKPDPAAFIQTFKGDNRYIVDYLVNEVLQKQPQAVRDFLLQTSILERLNVDLCQAVTRQADSHTILQTLDTARLFIIPLDDNRHWYRYHQLFADCLRAELQQTAPESVPTYHERASEWYEQHGFINEAVQHAFSADNQVLAAELLAEHARKLHWEQGQTSQLWQWLQQLPAGIIRTQPQLLITKARLSLEMETDYGSQIDSLLDEVEAYLASHRADYDSGQLAALLTEAVMTRASVARFRGDIDLAIQFSESAVQLSQNAPYPTLKLGARGSLNSMHLLAGHVSHFVEQAWSQLDMIDLGAPQQKYSRYVFVSYMLDALHLHGDLTRAEQIFRQLELSVYQQQGASAAMVVVSWATVLYLRNELNLAISVLVPALDKLKPLRSMVVPYQAGMATLARALQGLGRGEEVLILLAEQVANASDSRLSAVRAWLHLQRGDLPQARRWAEQRGFSRDDDVPFRLEFDYLVWCQLLVRQGRWQEAELVLCKLEAAMAGHGRWVRWIEVQVLLALVYDGLGDPGRATTTLHQAIQQAEPQAIKRPFLNAGQSLQPFLQQLLERGIAVPFIQSLQVAGGQAENIPPPQTKPTSVVETAYVLLSPLTKREKATLRYLATELNIPEIAQELVVAPSTVRTYVKNIYSKLDAHSRMDAVIRARALGLLD